MNSISDMPSHYSFDIFDTVLTRRLARPVDVFTLLGERLRKEGIRVPPFGLFRLLRIRCERWSRRFEPSYEVKLPDIHRLMGRFLFWSDEDQTRVAELEREIESAALRITPHGRRAVEEVRRSGGKIAYVSDMYLEAWFLKSVLEREGLLEENDLLAVSGEWKLSKAGGNIWPKLIETLGVEAGQILHQGDSRHSDLESPRKAGISSNRLGTAEVSRWEEWPKNHGAGHLERQGGIAAMSRLARAQCEDPDDYWTCLGAGILGPILAGFTAWTLKKARDGGIGTLWYLSRDGWLMLESARLMAGPDSPKLDYLCAGRRQLQVALAAPVDLSALFEGSRSQSLRLVGTRLGLKEEDLKRLAAESGLAEGPLDQGLDGEARSRILALLADEVWQERLKSAIAEEAVPVRGYLAQMKSQAVGSLAVVDVGWQGRSQDLLQQYLEDVPSLRGYYLGYSGSSMKLGTKEGWLYDFSAGRKSRTLHDHQRVFEVLIGGVSGPLRQYRQVDGAWEAVFDAEETGERAPGRDRAQKAALEFVRLAADPAYSDWWTTEDLHDFSTRNLDRLFLQPSSEDAERFKEWTASTDDAHLDSVPLVKGFDLPRIRACLKKEQPWAFLWPEAALRNSTRTGKWLMKAAWTAFKLRS
jgi:FMN phosphatase YigB (HAD superfamily)